MTTYCRGCCQLVNAVIDHRYSAGVKVPGFRCPHCHQWKRMGEKQKRESGAEVIKPAPKPGLFDDADRVEE